MDLEKLALIKDDILKESLNHKKPSSEFCGLYVDGTGRLTFEIADAHFWAQKVYSEYDYPIYLFVASNNNPVEIKKIIDKYPSTKVYNIPPLTNALFYNEWMLNYPWFLIDPKHPRVISFQEDGAPIKKGWEEYVIKGDWDFIGSPWKSEIQVLADKHYLKPLKVSNGGVSVRKIKSMIKVVQLINKEGGQHRFFSGIKIDGVLKQQNSWLAEDAMINAVGYSFDIFKPLSEEDAKKFGHEPIEYSLYMDKNNPARPYVYHKCDF